MNTHHHQTPLDDLERVVDQSGNIRLHDKRTGEMRFIGTKIQPRSYAHNAPVTPGKLYHLFNEMMINFPLDETLTQVEQPYSFQLPDYLIATECHQTKSLHDLPADFFFQSVDVFNPASQKWELEYMYLTSNGKKVLISIINAAWFTVTRSKEFIPVMKLEKMFLSKESNVIFSEYKLATHGAPGVSWVRDLFWEIQHKARGSDTLQLEFDDLIDWLTAWWTTLGPDTPLPTEFLTRMIFWTPKMRANYVRDLGEEVLNGKGKDVFNESQDAFRDSQTSGNWRSVVESTRHPVLMKLMDDGDKYFASRSMAHSLRTHNLAPQITWFTHGNGIVRMRDAFDHVSKKGGEDEGDDDIVHAYPREVLSEVITEVHLQYAYQSVFPNHMIELAKAIHLTRFDPLKLVKEVLQCSSNEV